MSSASIKNFLRLKRLVADHRLLATILFLLMLLSAISESFGLVLVIPLISSLAGVPAEGVGGGAGKYLEIIYDVLPANAQLEAVLLLLVLAFLAKTTLQIMARGLSTYVSLTLRESWSNQLLDHYFHANAAYLANNRQGEAAHNIGVEPFHASKSIIVMIDFGNRIILALALFIVLLFGYWQATVVIGLTGLVVIGGMRRVTTEFSLRFGKKRLKIERQITAIAIEAMAGVRQIKIFDLYHQWLDKLARRGRQYTKAQTTYDMVSDLPTHSTDLLMVIFLSAGLIILKRVLGADIESALVLLGFFVIVAYRLLIQINFIISRRMKVAATLPSLMLMLDLIEDAPTREDLESGQSAAQLTGDIVFSDVGFSYDQGAAVFDGLNLTIPGRKTTAIVGTSGVGKSTLADMLLGLQRPSSGTITIGGRDTTSLSLGSVRARIGYVSQDPDIFNVTVRDNILMGLPDAEGDAVIEAARLAHADQFIAALPDGYDTIVGDRGVKLSGGQRQRIAIARTILRQPDLYIFDEASSALDSESERNIRDSISNLARNSTVVIIAHRLTTIEGADIIYRLRSGRAEPLSHASLVSQDKQ